MPLLAKRPTTKQQQPSAIKGVNLGGWLVLEKWITPSLFKGSSAEDEYSLCETASDEQKAAIQKFRNEFIGLSDFRWLKEQGIDTVRLPVGYGAFGDQPPYLPTIEYVDRAFEWAYETDMKILLDIHAAPGSQNGKQESGRIGSIGWHKDEQNIITTLRFVEHLAERYGNRDALLGIELLNEPSGKIPRQVLLRYYEAAYKLIRKVAGDDIWVVFSDNFKPRRWKRKLRGKKYTNLYIDTHQYQAYSRRDRRLDILGHLKKTLRTVIRRLRAMNKRHPVIVGEWSAALNERSLKNLSPDQVRAARSAYGNAQLIAYDGAAAWFYWTYKTEDMGPWNFRKAVENGWLPITRK